MSNKPDALVLLTPGFARDEKDTTCIPAQQLFVKAVKRQNPSLKVIVLAFQYPFTKGRYKWNGIDVTSFDGRNGNKFRRLLVWIKVLINLFKIGRKHHVIGLLSFWLGECAFIGGIYANLCRLRHFCWMLGQDAKAGNPYYRLIRLKADRLIAISDFIADEFSKNYHLRPSHVIPIGVDPEAFPDENQERSIDILGAGSVIPLKRFDLFIETVKKLTFTMPGLRVLICGNGPDKEKLLQKIEKSGLNKVISLVDELPHYEMLRLMQKAKIFLHTSSYEGFPAVCAEALCAGAHVVSFCRPVKAEVRQWHIVNSKKELIQALERLLSHPALTHEKVVPFSVENACAEIMRLFCRDGITERSKLVGDGFERKFP